MAFMNFMGQGTLHSLGRLNRAARRRAKALGVRLAARRQMAARQSSDNIPSPVRIENLEGRCLLSASVYDQNGFYIPSGGPTINTFSGGGTVTFMGSSSEKNTMSVSLSSNGTTLIGTMNGVTSDFPLDKVSEIKMFGGNDGNSIDEASNVLVPTAIQGGTGNDTIITGNGNDTVDGSTGADSIVCGNGTDIARAEGDDATLTAGTGATTLIANGSDDLVKGGSTENLLLGYGKDDTLTRYTATTTTTTTSSSSTGGAVPATESSNTTSTSGSTSSTTSSSSPALPTDPPAGTYDHNGFYIPPGGPTITSFTGGGYVDFVGDTNKANTMTLTQEGQTLVGTMNGVTSYFPVDMVGTVKMWTGDDSDSISISPSVTVPVQIQANGSGNDSILAEGSGNVTIHGNTGHDSIVLGAGNSDIAWGPGNYTTLVAGSGNDTIFASGDDDSVLGGPGYDELISSGENDTVKPGSANNYGDFVEAIATPPVTSTVDPSISATGPTTIQAGHMIAVQALDSGLPSGVTALTALFQWNFGDTTSGSQYNTLEGFNAAHEYNTPGKYTITLKITLPNGTTDTTTMPVTVLAPSVRTIYVSTSGSNSNSGLSPSSPIQSIAQVNSMLSSNTTVLFEDGDTFDMSTGLNINGYSNVTLSNYGSGADPVFMWSGARDGAQMITTESGSLDVTIQNITFNSIFDTDTSETGMPFAIVPEGFDISIVGCTFLNVGYAVQGAGAPVGLLVENCSVPSLTGLRGYFVWVEGTDINIYGNNVVTSCDEHDIRDVGANRVNISYNTLQNLDTKATISLEEGEYVYVYKNTLKYGGAGAQTPQNVDSATAAAARMEWVVFDSNTAIGMEFQIGPATDHLMFRNNISFISSGQAYNINSYNSEYDTNVSDLTIVNNTAIDSGVSGDFLKTSSAGETGVDVVNNLFVAPKLEIGINGSYDVYITASSTAGLTFSHNVWAVGVPTREDPAAELYMSPDLSMSGMLSPAQWNAEPGVSDDHFASVTLNSDNEPATDSIAYTGGIWVAGVYLDAGGDVRTSADFGVGAFLPEG